ncbi:MAG: N-acyl homoserine lactonase family protein [Kiloniellaceae bacterium]
MIEGHKPPCYEVLALRYATVARQPQENFISPDPHDGPLSMDYFVWVIRGEGRNIVVDTGFGAQAAQRRGRRLLQPPRQGLEALGIDCDAVADVVITHLHYDHAGNLQDFPKATFHLQDAEIAYATGRLMCHGMLRHAYNVEDVVTMVRKVYAGRVCFHDGAAEIAPGVTLHRVGGHTQGLQVVRVPTGRGAVVLASDAAHFYANIRNRDPFPIVVNVGDMLEAYETVERLADSPDHVIPGHDPEVMRLYPRTDPGAGRVEAVALHRPPLVS